jgi:DNA-binding response OmpR family regulator
MRRHHGGLEVRSLPGQGTVFVVFLPSATQCHVERVCDPEPQRVLDQTSATLLLAEDEEMVRAPLREFLILSGFQVIEAINGEEAVELFLAHQEKIDLLVFDMVMPKMSGYSAYRAIAQWRSDIPVLFLSGYSEHAMPIRELNNKGLEMVTKPIFPHELEARIRHMLDAHAAAPPSLTPPG